MHVIKYLHKDLSTIAVPVTFNEPLTLLQRAAEEVEYYDLLTQAASSPDPIERMRFVAAFAVSNYAHTRHRSGRKGLFVTFLITAACTQFYLVIRCWQKHTRMSA